MYRAISTQDALVNYLNNNAISDNGQGKGYNSVNWYLGGTSTRYGKIVLETPANPNSFELAEDHGGFMSGNPYVRQAHSSNDAPVRFDELSRILFLDKTGKRVLYQIDTNSSYDINRDITIGNLLQEQDELMTTKNYYDSTIKDRAKLEKMSDEAKANLIEKSDQTNLKLEMINRKLYLSQATFDSEFTKIDVDTKSVGLKMGDAYAAGDDKETVKYFTEYDRLDNKRMIFRDNKKELAKLKEMVNAEGYNSLRDYGKLSYEEGLNLLDNKIQNATNNHDYTLAEKLMSKKEKYIKNFYVSPEEQLQANELANRLHETAKQIEPEVTQTIKELETPNAIIMDENHKLKKPNRIAAKILTSNKGKGKTILNPVIKDSLRYTYVIDKNNYVNEVNRIVDSLNEKGYNTYQLNNSWTSDGYKGINVTFMNENRNLFEVQFHTDESYIEKSSLTHEPYEIFRNSYLDDDIKRTARDIQNNFDRSVAIPPNVKTIKEINNTNMYDVRRETDAKQR